MKFFYLLLFFLLNFLFIHVNAAEGDRDNDGVADIMDSCPDTAQLKKISPDFKYAAAVNPQRLTVGEQAYPVDKNGCEFDSDKDGVVNSKDYCLQNTKKELSKGIALNGCPKHSDFDGTPDYRDQCPDTPRSVKTDKQGCQY